MARKTQQFPMRRRQGWILKALLLCAAAAALSGLAASPAHAKPEYQEVFDRTYKPADSTLLGKASCQTCHVAAGPPQRNVYGKELEKALREAGTKTLTEAILRQVESADSDSDGAGNQAELTAGSLPGDAKSLPQPAAVAATPTPTPPAASATTPATAVPRASAPKPRAASTPAAAAPKAKPGPAARTPQKNQTALPPKAAAAASPAVTSTAATKAKPAARPDAPKPVPARPSTPSTRAPAPAAPAAAAATAEPSPQEAAPVKSTTPAPAAPPPPPPSVTAAPTSGLVTELFNRIVPPHSFHPVIVHFPIALFLFGGICELLGAWKRRPTLRAAGALNMTAASITALGALATGFLSAWRSGFPLTGLTLIHLLLAIAATASMAATALIGWSFIHLHRERTSRIYWVLLVVSLLLIGLVGHFGGELVYGS